MNGFINYLFIPGENGMKISNVIYFSNNLSKEKTQTVVYHKMSEVCFLFFITLIKSKGCRMKQLFQVLFLCLSMLFFSSCETQSAEKEKPAQVNNQTSITDSQLRSTQQNSTSESFDKISVGALHLCAVSSGKLKCIGYDWDNQLHLQENLSNVVDVNVGGYGGIVLFPEYNRYYKCSIDQRGTWNYDCEDSVVQTCALTNTSAVCWGYTVNRSSLGGKFNYVVENLKSPTQVSVGAQYSCATTEEGVVCWTRMGRILDERSFYPKPPPKNSTVVRLGAGYNRNYQDKWGKFSEYGCALADGTMSCWSFNQSAPAKIQTAQNVKYFLTKSEEICWLLNDNTLNCGNIFFDNDVSRWSKDESYVQDSNQFFYDSAKFHLICASKQSGIGCRNSYIDLETPPGLEEARALASGGLGICALNKLGHLVCWKYNQKEERDSSFQLLDFEKLENPIAFDCSKISIFLDGRWSGSRLNLKMNCDSRLGLIKFENSFLEKYGSLDSSYRWFQYFEDYYEIDDKLQLFPLKCQGGGSAAGQIVEDDSSWKLDLRTICDSKTVKLNARISKNNPNGMKTLFDIWNHPIGGNSNVNDVLIKE